MKRLLLFVSGKTGTRMVCRGSNGYPQKASDLWEMGPTSGKSWVLTQSRYSNLSVRDFPLFSPESIQPSGDSNLTFLSWHSALRCWLTALGVGTRLRAVQSLATAIGPEIISECQQDPVRLLGERNMPYFSGNTRNEDVSLELLLPETWD